MLEAARHGWSGIPVWATPEDIQGVYDRHPEVFKKRRPSPPLLPFVRHGGLSEGHRNVRLCRDAGSADALPVGRTDAPVSSSCSSRPSGDAHRGSPAGAPVAEDDDGETVVEGWQDFEEEEDPAAVLQFGLSVVSIDRPDGTGEQWHSERYNVREGYVKDMCFRLKVQPVLDAFADAGNHRFPVWYKDAFAVRWPQDEVIWANPPFSMLQQVVEKIKRDGAKVLLVCPDWRSCSWWKSLQEHVVRRHYYPKGTAVFELDKKPVGGIRWGLWAYYVDGSVEKEDEYMETNKEYSVAELEGEWQDTPSYRRRQRRKMQKQGGQ